jgi:hypothetical protein
MRDTSDPALERYYELLRARLALRLYGREVALRLFPGAPLDVG